MPSSRIRLLIVEDEPQHVQLMRRAFAGGPLEADISEVGTLSDFRAAVADDPPDLVIMDLNLPDGKATDVLVAPPDYGPVPVVVVTAFGDERTGIEAVKAGAIEYLAKSQAAFLDLPRIVESALRQWEHITRRRDAEAELRRLNAELETRIADRTAHLEGAVAELEAFTNSVAHDLRSPLRAIIGFGDALKDEASGKLDVQSLHYIDRMCDAAERMSRLIEDLLALSRVNRAEIQRSSVHLSLIAEDVVRRLRQAEPERQVDVHIQADLRVEADPGLMMRLMENLLGNAWKFTGKRERASIEVAAEAGPGERAYFVRDNGAGFDMAFADKLFIPFQRLHGRTEYPGTGIGLSIAQRIVLRHGGRIWAEARLDEGATFYFTLGHSEALPPNVG